MSPAALKRALDPAYIGSPFAQPFQFFDGDASTPMDLTGRAVVLFLDRQGLPDAHHEITGVIQTEGRVLFTVADTSAWIKGDYSLEVRLDGASVVVGRIAVAKGAGANGSDIVGAAQPPTAPGVVIAGSGVVQVVSVAPSGTTEPSAIILPPDLSAALGGAETLADALLWLAQNGGTPSPILRDLIGNVVISSVATGALSVAAAGQVLLSGAISSVSSATGSLTVGAASSITLVGSAVSTSSLIGAMTIVKQIALAGTATGSSVVTGSLSNTAPVVTYLPTTPAPLLAYSTARLFAAYTNPLLRAVRESDAASTDLVAGSDGAVDMSGLTAFAAGSGVVTDRWYDQAYVVNGGSAGANDAVQATAANRPRIRPENAMRGKQPVSMGLTSAGISGANIALALPSVATTRQSVTRIWVGALISGPRNTDGIWGLGNNATATNNLSLVYDTNGLRPVDNRLEAGALGPATAQLAIYSLVSGPTSQKLYCNGVQILSKAAPSDIALTGGWLGLPAWSSVVTGCSDVCADVLYSTPLSDADRIAVETVLAQRFGITYAGYTKIVGFDGHSIPQGLAAGGFYQNLVRKTTNAWNGPLPKTPNFAISGQTAEQIYNRRASTANSLEASNYSKKALVVQMATNSIAALPTDGIVGGGATIFNNYILPYIRYMKTTGGFGNNVVVLTDVPRVWGGTSTDSAQKEAERQSVIQLTKDNAATEGYTVVDWGSLPAMTTGVLSNGNPNPPNLTYYGDTIHPNAAGYALCQALLQPVLEAMLS